MRRLPVSLPWSASPPGFLRFLALEAPVVSTVATQRSAAAVAPYAGGDGRVPHAHHRTRPGCRRDRAGRGLLRLGFALHLGAVPVIIIGLR